jgi:ParB-like chromosome segregation protein Spo0J
MSERLRIDWTRWRLGPVEPRAVAELRPAARRALDLRGLDDGEYALLLASVRAWGVVDPLLVTSDGRVVDGQARLRAARQAGIETVPVRVVQDGVTAEALAGLRALGRRQLSGPDRFAVLQGLRPLLEGAPGRRARRAEAASSDPPSPAAPADAATAPARAAAPWRRRARRAKPRPPEAALGPAEELRQLAAAVRRLASQARRLRPDERRDAGPALDGLLEACRALGAVLGRDGSDQAAQLSPVPSAAAAESPA